MVRCTRDKKTEDELLFHKYIRILHRNKSEKYVYLMSDNYVLQKMKKRLGKLVSNIEWMTLSPLSRIFGREVENYYS